jgi:hypothetical protein
LTANAFRRASNYDETGWRRGLAPGMPTVFLDKIVSCPHLEALQDGPHNLVLSMIMKVQAPLALAQLPRPLETGGKNWFNSVYGVSTLRKVKRYEVVAAVDGEAVNLYDVNIDPVVPSQVCLDADCRSRYKPPG